MTGTTTTLPPLPALKAAASAVFPEQTFARFRVYDGGWANLVLEADDRMMFRFPRRKAVAVALGFEVRALDLLSGHLSAAIPAPIRLATLERPRGWPFIAYPKLPGQPVSEVGLRESLGSGRLRAFVGRLLRELAEVPPAELRGIGASPGDPADWETRYRSFHRRFRGHGAALLPPKVRAAVDAGFQRFYTLVQDSRFEPVALHRDLGPDHLLWDPTTGRPSGVIDWEDLCLGDPVFDLTGLGSLGEPAVHRWLRERSAGGDRHAEGRLSFYRRVGPVHGVVHAAESGDLRWLRRFGPLVASAFAD
ncbi:MAG: aminoglycoside phosphotransferase family protein [Thermoplasmata archaeon]|nr:aminoglycoside phosphotransferase family protein [Thermoplasmata archaeon]